MRVEKSVKLDFDDVLIRPKRSKAPSRRAVDLDRTFECLHGGTFTCLPIVAANMNTIGTFKMARALAKHQALTCLHKFYDITTLNEFWTNTFYEEELSVFYTLGVRAGDLGKLKNFARYQMPTMICLDAANGYSMYFVERLQQLRAAYPNSIVMAGNVVTPEMVQELLLQGADIVKIGIGPGSVCTTRIETGVGYPQLSAIIECSDAAHGLGGLVCADGGCRTPGDVAKAFAGGADLVMLGGMLAGCDECDGEWTDDGFVFYGMSSERAQEKFYGGVPSYATPEGECIHVPKKGPAGDVLKRITGGLRSACSYVGAARLKDLTKCATFVRISK